MDAGEDWREATGAAAAAEDFGPSGRDTEGGTAVLGPAAPVAGLAETFESLAEARELLAPVDGPCASETDVEVAPPDDSTLAPSGSAEDSFAEASEGPGAAGSDEAGLATIEEDLSESRAGIVRPISSARELATSPGFAGTNERGMIGETCLPASRDSPAWSAAMRDANGVGLEAAGPLVVGATGDGSGETLVRIPAGTEATAIVAATDAGIGCADAGEVDPV